MAIQIVLEHGVNAVNINQGGLISHLIRVPTGILPTTRRTWPGGSVPSH